MTSSKLFNITLSESRPHKMQSEEEANSFTLPVCTLNTWTIISLLIDALMAGKILTREQLSTASAMMPVGSHALFPAISHYSRNKQPQISLTLFIAQTFAQLTLSARRQLREASCARCKKAVKFYF